jgi:hypothetical protein
LNRSEDIGGVRELGGWPGYGEGMDVGIGLWRQRRGSEVMDFVRSCERGEH